MADSSYYTDQQFQDLLGSPASYPIGLPADTQSTAAPPGFETTTASISSPPKISTWDNIWGTVKQDSQSALSWTEAQASNVYSGSKKVVKTVYTDVEGGAATLVSDVTQPLKITYWYLIGAIIVIAGALYFIGKGGAVKANVIL